MAKSIPEEDFEEDDITIEKDSLDEGFIEGFEVEEESEECAECGTAINPERKVTREIEGEKFRFCSKDCADEYEESMG